MDDYLAVIVGVMFDESYNFEDILVHGVAHSPVESFAIEAEEIARLYEDFGNDEHRVLEYSESRSQYDEPITVIKYASGYEHIYCMFPYGMPDERRKRREKDGDKKC